MSVSVGHVDHVVLSFTKTFIPATVACTLHDYMSIFSFFQPLIFTFCLFRFFDARERLLFHFLFFGRKYDHLWLNWVYGSIYNWAATQQNQQCGCALSKDSDQPGHLPNLIRVFPVHMKKPWVLSYRAHSEDSDQTGRTPRLIWVFTGCTVILLVLSWGSSTPIWILCCPVMSLPMQDGGYPLTCYVITYARQGISFDLLCLTYARQGIFFDYDVITYARQRYPLTCYVITYARKGISSGLLIVTTYARQGISFDLLCHYLCKTGDILWPVMS